MLRLSLCAALLLAAGPAAAELSPGPTLLADANKDGKVSKAEYLTSRRQAIMRADRDRDGRVSGAEWDRGAAFLRAEVADTGTQGWEKIGHAGVFALIDTNKDSFATPAEIDGYFAPRFDRIDASGDGVADRLEIARAEKLARR